MADFVQVRRELARAARLAFGELREQHPKEHFYAFALYDSDDVNGPSPSANSEEKYAFLSGRLKRKSPRDLAIARWGTAEWGYEAVGCEHFADSGGMLRELREATDFKEYKAQAFAAMAGALCDLDAEGFFGTGADRLAVTAFASLSDSSHAAWLERESARLANPPAVFKEFEKGWRLLNEEEADKEGGRVYERFLEIVKAWPARS